MDTETTDLLARALETNWDDEPNQAPAVSHEAKWRAGWRPRLNHLQQEAHDSDAIFILLWGERSTGKTFGAAHSLVENCYLNRNGLGIIIVKEIAQATDGGVWYKLIQEVLPAWEKGNRGPKGELLDEGIGLPYTPPKVDLHTKRAYLWMANIHGGWSMILLLSLPHAHQVTGKVKGKEPSFVLVDEAQTMQSGEYFKAIVQQLGRRRDTTTPQKIIFCANPDSPSHWLYQRFFVLPVNPKTHRYDKRYAQFHITKQDNIRYIPKGYYEDYLKTAVAGDATEEARMIGGQWVDRPSGECLFRNHFSSKFHVRGDPMRCIGITPQPGQEIIVSYDLGTANSTVHFEQRVVTTEKVFKIVFDEIDYVDQHVSYRTLVPKIIDRMLYWDEYQADGKRLGPFRFIHISDNSAFNQFRAKDGSHDALDVEVLSREEVEKRKLDEKFVIKMKACPKGPNSIEARVRMVKDDLDQSALMISATCRRTIEMMNQLEEDPENHVKPKPKTRQIHRFDSMTYGFFYYHDRNRRWSPDTREVEATLIMV